MTRLRTRWGGGPDGAGDLVEQGADLGGVTLLMARQLAGEDLTSAWINGQVELAPGPFPPPAVLLERPSVSEEAEEQRSAEQEGKGRE
jgi:hypothetical protein